MKNVERETRDEQREIYYGFWELLIKIRRRALERMSKGRR